MFEPEARRYRNVQIIIIIYMNSESEGIISTNREKSKDIIYMNREKNKGIIYMNREKIKASFT